MTYASRSDLEKRVGAEEVAQRESALPGGAVEGALQDADELINGYLANRYALPLTMVPGNLLQIACALARYNLLGEAATDRSREDYKDAMAWLRDVQAGRVLLQAAQPLPGNEPATVVMASTSPAVFRRNGRP